MLGNLAIHNLIIILEWIQWIHTVGTSELYREENQVWISVRSVKSWKEITNKEGRKKEGSDIGRNWGWNGNRVEKREERKKKRGKREIVIPKQIGIVCSGIVLRMRPRVLYSFFNSSWCHLSELECKWMRKGGWRCRSFVGHPRGFDLHRSPELLPFFHPLRCSRIKLVGARRHHLKEWRSSWSFNSAWSIALLSSAGKSATRIRHGARRVLSGRTLLKPRYLYVKRAIVPCHDRPSAYHTCHIRVN